MSKLTGIFFLIITVNLSFGQVRIKDIASVEGARANVLSGLGLVVGLAGTGDKDQTKFTTQALSNVLAKSGIAISPTDIKVKNVALVLVQAELPPFARSGSRLDVTVSSTGDAISLQGGTLLLSELKAIDGNTYALAQGPLSIGGFSAGGGGSTVVKNHPTVGRIPDGAMVERSLDFPFLTDHKVRFIFNNSDFTTMNRAIEAVNQSLGATYASPLNPRVMEVHAPQESWSDMIGFVARVENVTLNPDAEAKVVINERTGTIVIGQNVRVDKVAIAHGNLTIQIQTQNTAVPSGAVIGGANTVIQTNLATVAVEEAASVVVAPPGVSLGTIADTLNSLKVSPRDIIAIFQAMKEAGAIHAELKLI